MDKQKEIEKMAFSICPMPQAAEYITDCTKCGYNGDCPRQKYAKKFIEKGYGNVREAVRETAQDIFSWIYRNLVNMNFITGNVEINLSALDTFAKTYGVEKFGFPEQTENKND